MNDSEQSNCMQAIDYTTIFVMSAAPGMETHRLLNNGMFTYSHLMD